MAWMYIARCSDGSYCTGSTALESVDARIWQHNHDDGLAAAYTRRRRPITLSYVEQFERVEDAFAREKQVQGWSRAKKEALVNGRFGELPTLSSSHRDRSSGISSPLTGSGNDNER